MELVVTKIKKIKIAILFSLFGFIAMISFITLLLSNHLYNIRLQKTKEELKNSKNFTLVLKEEKNCQNKKNKLFSFDGIDFYGICLEEVALSFRNLHFPLQEVLKEKDIQLKDLYKKTTKIKEVENAYEVYQNKEEKYTITNTHVFTDISEIVFNKES